MTCQHEGCTCQVEATAEYCSEHCREHGQMSHEATRCECGHPECQGTLTTTE